MRFPVSLAFLIALLLFAPPLPAQNGSFWFSAGVGAGSQRVACDICRGDRHGGWGARLALGHGLNARLDAGAEINGWTDESDGIRFRVIAVVPSLYWRPSVRKSYFLLGGVGYHSYRASNDDESLSSSGLAVTVGAGLDLPLAARFRLTPFTSLTASFLSHLKLDRTDVASARLTLLQAGFALTRR